MRLTPALAYEKLRQEADSMNKIILNKDGKWYHVYEWSAWLLKTVVCTEEMQQARGDAKPLAVSHCNTKTGDYVMAGFPLESVAKYIPEYTDMNEMEDGDLCIGITLPDELAALTPDEMTAAYEEWKQAQPLKENRKSVRQITSGDTKPAPPTTDVGIGMLIPGRAVTLRLLQHPFADVFKFRTSDPRHVRPRYDAVFPAGKAASKREQSCLHELPSVSRLTSRMVGKPQTIFRPLVRTC